MQEDNVCEAIHADSFAAMARPGGKIASCEQPRKLVALPSDVAKECHKVEEQAPFLLY